MNDFNGRILIIDDNEAIHADFKKALKNLSEQTTNEFLEIENLLTQNQETKISLPNFELTSAFQGEEGFELAKRALEEDNPYALAFVDIRMPPGWDGIETIEAIWKVDNRIQTVICTAHSDYSWEEIFKRLGHSDRLLILKKPFDLVEIRLSALALTKKWTLNRQANLKLNELQEMTDRQTKEIALSLSLTEATLESTADGIIVVDKDKKIIKYNKKFLQIWGLTLENIKDKNAQSVFESMKTKMVTPLNFSMDIEKLLKDFGSFREMKLKNHTYIEQYLQPQFHENTIVGVVYSFRDITQRKNLEMELSKQATFDHLTGLPNRLLLVDRIQQAIAYAKRNKTYVAILFMDLDSFKLVNDSFGHEVGDELLKIFAQRLKNCLRESDTIIRLDTISSNTAARLGGDEFVVVLTTNVNEHKDIITAIQRIYDVLVMPYNLAGRELTVTLSIGVSFFPQDGEDPITLIKNADSAMYHAKENGRGTFEFYVKEMSDRSLARLELENDLRQAFANKELFLNFQPLFDTVDKKIASLEVLIRWNHPKYGLIPPTTFIPIAESNGLINLIGLWLLRTACAQNKAWQDQGLPAIPISVNISGVQFKQKTIVEDIKRVLKETGLDPKYLELELTENIIMSDNNDVTDKITKLKEIGVIIDIDDFGTGYSSLSYINQFPIDKIKIDQSFIHKLSKNSETQTIVQAILMIAKSLNMCVVAEGVETDAQLEILQKISTDIVQGYFLSLPLSLEETTEMLKKHLQPSNFPTSELANKKQK